MKEQAHNEITANLQYNSDIGYISTFQDLVEMFLCHTIKALLSLWDKSFLLDILLLAHSSILLGNSTLPCIHQKLYSYQSGHSKNQPYNFHIHVEQQDLKQSNRNVIKCSRGNIIIFSLVFWLTHNYVLHNILKKLCHFLNVMIFYS